MAGGFLGKLGSLFVEVQAKGVDLVQAGFLQAGGAAQKLAATAQQSGQHMAAAVKAAQQVLPGLASSLQTVAQIWQGIGAAKNPFNLKELGWTASGLAEAFKGASQSAQGLAGAIMPATSLLSGLAMAGMHASAEGQLLNFQMQELAHQVGSVFAPQIRAAVDALGRLVDWFQRLDGDGQAQLRFWGLLGASIMGASIVLPKVIASVQALGVAFKGVQAVMAGLSLANPWLLALAAIALVVVALMDFKDIGSTLGDVARTISSPFQDLLKVVVSIRDALKEAAGESAKIKPELQDDERELGAVEAGLGYAQGRDATRRRRQAEGKPDSPGANFWGGFTEFMMRLSNPTYGLISGTRSSTIVKKERDERTDLGGQVGSFEDYNATWRRIAVASMRATSGRPSVAEESRDYLREITETVRRLDGTEVRAVVGR